MADTTKDNAVNSVQTASNIDPLNGSKVPPSTAQQASDGNEVRGSTPNLPTSITGLTDLQTIVAGRPRTVEKLDEEESAQLSQLNQIIKEMEAAIKIQKNMARPVKDGVVKLQEIADRLRTVGQEKTRLLENRMALLASFATPKPSAETPHKRSRSSPNSPNGQGQSNSPNDGELRDGEWTQIRKKKKKTRLLQAKSSSEKGTPKRPEVPTMSTNTGDSPVVGRTKGAKEKRKRLPRPRHDAIIIRPGQGKSYADVLGKIKGGVNLQDTETEIRRIRKTRDGDVLLEIGKSKDKESLKNAVAQAVTEEGTVKSMEPRLRLELLDLDSCVTEAEVEDAVRQGVSGLLGDLKVTVFPPNAREERMAILDLDEAPARQLLATGRVRVGWVNARVRKRIDAQRCYRCLGFGHTRHECRGPDRSRLCRKCGKVDHKAAACVEESPCCYLCPLQEGVPQRHIAGSGICRAFKDVLAQCKKKAGR